MVSIILSINQATYREISAVLRSNREESAGFLFASPKEEGESTVFEGLEWFPVPPDGFLSVSEYHFVLTDDVRAKVIKRAHDLGSSLVEFHSHTGDEPAAFSPSDHRGFEEFVPHVRWRLRGRPYLAVVITRSDFDGLAWVSESTQPRRLDGLVVDGNLQRPTHLSTLGWRHDDEQSI